MKAVTTLEGHFAPFRKNIIGQDATFEGPYGQKRILYADWTASGRLYGPIEDRFRELVGPWVANTHTETSETGKMMTHAYHEAREIIKQHVHAGPKDVLIAVGTGMTGAVNKFQRLLGLRLHDFLKPYVQVPEAYRPVVFISHMEHHSNQTSWLETLAHVEIIAPNADGLMDLNHLQSLLQKHASNPNKIASITGCSNVTGIETPYREVARMMHQWGGLCFVDFACSGPYVDIRMHTDDPLESLDAIFFSPHKFLGGPGTPGILVFNSDLYKDQTPDMPGGGTVTWTNPWGQHHYFRDIEVREDGGTPGFLQTIKAAMAIRLKEAMGVDNILAREHEQADMLWEALTRIPNLKLLADNMPQRLGVFSFYIEHCHFNLAVRLLNDRFGIQTRGGCSCAGTYGHYLLHLDEDTSSKIFNQVDNGNFAMRPGWVRASIHPTMTDAEITYLADAIRQVAENHQVWGQDYRYQPATNEYHHLTFNAGAEDRIHHWFEF
jgi:selenocysteine lyase/cysteine desulfurase